MDYLLVSGIFFADGGGLLEPVYRFTSNNTFVTPAPGDAYCLALQDDSGNTLDEQCVDVSFLDHRTLEPLDQVGFAFIFPNPSGATQVALQQDQEVVAGLTASANPPTISILTPQGGESWSGTQTISWQADDSDGDTLVYAVQYSADKRRKLADVDHKSYRQNVYTRYRASCRR